MEQLDAAHVALERGQSLPALDALLEAWRLTRNPSIADLIDGLTVVLERSLPPITEQKRKAFHERWLDLANAQRPWDLGRLLRGWTTQPWSYLGERVDRLVQRPDDPRIAMALARFVEALPTTNSAGESTWTAAFKLLIRIGDVRCIALLEARKAQPGNSVFHEQLGPRIAKVLLALAKVEPVPVDAQTVQRVQRAIADLGIQPAPSEAAVLRTAAKKNLEGPTEEELLRRIFERPTDDAARLVYADFLSERGDLRGELIALQFKTKPTGREQRRIRELVRQHGRAWLGEIEPAIEPKSEGFARGFLSNCRLKFRTPAQKEHLALHPAWNTLTRLWVWEDREAFFLLPHPLTGLEEIDGVLSADLAARMAQRPSPYPRLAKLKLNLTGAGRDQLDAVAAAAAFPALVALGLNGAGQREEQLLSIDTFAWLFDSPLGKRLEQLELSYLQVNLIEWLRRLSLHPTLRQLDVAGWPPLSFRREEGGWRARVQAVYRADTEALAALQPLASAGLLKVVELTAVQRGEERAREKLQQALSGVQIVEVKA